ncbi:MAG: type I DNA topoisomerase [Cyclobacteriaceae bacterium]|nr:type I DNA topoisomerase [Cyclobacteriaceae bacterium]
MPKNLVIVESPAKAKTIEGYLGKEFKVKSSFGHVRDLPKDNQAIDIENGFKPTYEIPKDKKDIISQLKKDVKDVDFVFLASDDDREGEAISWHLKEALELNDSQTRRIVFREITKNAILNAIQNPRNINYDLVYAQQARRILDRLVGFELSPLLWKKIKTGLSAGRVQSVAVRLVVDREREIEKFIPESFYKVSAIFQIDAETQLKAEHPRRFKTEEEAVAFLESCREAVFSIRNLEKKPSKKSPSPPFTTSTLQQEASRKLGFSVSQTMIIAQKLYESGKISYMRTDSVHLSREALFNAKNVIIKDFGDEYSKTRQYKTKSESAQEAHEAIRPTDFSSKTIPGDRNEQKLYDLIWKRAIASQMADAMLERTIVTIGISNLTDTLTATGEIIKFKGFLALYHESSDDEAENEEADTLLPPLKTGQELDLLYMSGKQGYTRAPLRYTEASLVKKLEELGIGRPSTYAPTISTIQKRNYVTKESKEGKTRTLREIILKNNHITSKDQTENYGFDKNKLSPTNIGMVVNDFLVNYFPGIIDFSFTARIEKEFDDISQGKIEWDQMIDRFYRDFHPMVENTEQVSRSEARNVREVGIEPESGKKVFAKLGKYGPIIQIGEGNGDEKPKFASLLKGQYIETISLEEALQLFKLPREVGTFEGKEIVAGIGRYGPYIRFENKFISLDNQDPLQIREEEAIELINVNRKTEAEKLIKKFDEDKDVSVLKGKYGPYIKFGKKNVKIPRGKEPASLTFDECVELAEKTPAKKGRFKRKK